MRFLLIIFFALGYLLPDVAVAQGLVTCTGLDCDFCKLGELTNNLINWLFGFMAIVAVMIAVVAGFRLVTANGNQSEMEWAKARIMYVIVGFLLMLASWLIVDTILRGLTGSERGMNFWGSFDVSNCGGMHDPQLQPYIDYDPETLASFGYVSREQLLSDEQAGQAAAGRVKTFTTGDALRACDTSQLTSVTAFGQTFKTNQAMVPALERANSRWEAAGGKDFYNVDQVGSYHCRNKRGSNSLSNHAYGMAIDFNWSGSRNYGRRADGSAVTDMPPEFSQIMREEGFGWGGDWCSLKDAMHFSMGPEESRAGCPNGS